MFLTKLHRFAGILVTLAVVGLSAGLVADRVLAGHELGEKPVAAVAEVVGEREAENADLQKEGKRDGDKKNASLSGVLRGVDAAKKQIVVVTGGDGQAEEFTFTVGPETKLSASYGGVITVADLAPRMRVQFKLSANPIILSALVAQAPTMTTVLKAVDATAGTVTVPEEGRVRALPVAKEAKIVVDRKEVKLADVPVGPRVALTLSMKRDVVHAIQASTGKGGDGEGGDKPAGRPRPDLRGTIQKLDAARGKLDLLIHRENGDEMRTVEIAKDAKVAWKFLKTATVADLREGVDVMIFLTMDKAAAAQIDVNGPTMAGVVGKLDAAAGRLTLKANERVGADTALPIAKNARAFQGGKEIKLADVPSGSRVTLLLNSDRSVVLALQIVARAAGDKEK